MTAGNFWDYDVWSIILLLGTIGVSILLAGMIKHWIKPLRKSLIPSSVLGGLLLLIISFVVFEATGGIKNGGKYLFELDCFNGPNLTGMTIMEIITYHCLGLGFIAMALRQNDKKFSGQRAREVFDSGVTTVSGYLMQGFLGLSVTIIAVWLGYGIWNGSGIILPFGYGQGSGQAMTYGSLYVFSETTPWGFLSKDSGRSFGLAIAALGFLSACIGGVIFMDVMVKKGKIKVNGDDIKENYTLEQIVGMNEIPMSGSVDKLTVQIGIVMAIYAVSYFLMEIICTLFGLNEALRATIYGFNFLLGTFLAMALKGIIGGMRKKRLFKRKFINTFLMNRIGGFFFDFMIVAGIAAIRIDVIVNYWLIIVILGFVGAVSTYFYVWHVSKKLFGQYSAEQFLAFYGMLTGTASTGIILLREIDHEFKTPAADNLVYQNLPAIVLGFPMMFLGTYIFTGGQTAVYVTWGICFTLFLAMQLILFRKYIFRSKKSKALEQNPQDTNNN